MYSLQKEVGESKKEVRIGHYLASHQRSSKELASPLLHKVDNCVPNTLSTDHLSLPHSVASVDKELLADIRKAPHLCTGGSIDRYEAVLPVLQVNLMPLVKLSYLFEKKVSWLFIRQMLCVIGFVPRLVERFTTSEGESLRKSVGGYGLAGMMVYMAFKKPELNHV